MKPGVEWGQPRTCTDNEQFGADLHAALVRTPKAISPKYFYDEAGSRLFEQICELPEYYPTRTELALLEAHAADMAEQFGPGVQLVEYGAGALRKVRLLLDALPRDGAQFVPVDISGPHLLAACDALAADYPGLAIQPLVADFTQAHTLPPCPDGSRRVGFFPGSSIGNFTPAEAEAFLRLAAAELAGGGLLIGIDLEKDHDVLHAAYNDAAGVTAAFNLNVLERARKELGAEFPQGGFEHLAFYNPAYRRIEMHLRATRPLELRVGGEAYAFREGETLHTEHSHKYTVSGFQAMAERAGFRPGKVWMDANRWFAVLWLEAAGG
ncbi:L-histidine N(alpha)-methyltransferase [Roseateles saccharophilus]|uniref:Dimethylhistidine N-methyltransferase n=1 Tax=Roseateles saccharophilus TaxID=304 RepID=A0A4R3ULT4_ROSSA|nr:L-histidine N(alpha)-methyltransferase [Roseateles saccharophilus]MDG0833948.1 L-histidine N(alpha)-methyltransferase [Roseateles saccharophilus]TCU91108.1 dimethylhistidine N-methyltransferase [Roseateles saccharophilus]